MEQSVPTGRIFNIQKFSLNDGPGIRTTVFFWGCPLRCRWCSNPESQLRCRARVREAGDESLMGRDRTVEEVLRQVEQDAPFYEESGGGMTLSGGEPLWQSGFALELIRRAKARGISCAMETTGFAAPEVFDRVTGELDLILMDVKHWDPEKHLRQTGVRNDLILQNLRRGAAKGIPVIARIPVIPGFNFSLPDADGIARLLIDAGVGEAQLLPFHQFGERKYEKLGLPYEMKGVKQLHPEDLDQYRERFLQMGLRCEIR